MTGTDIEVETHSDTEVTAQAGKEVEAQDETVVTTQANTESSVHTYEASLECLVTFLCSLRMLIMWHLDYGMERYKYFILSSLFITV